MMASGVHPDHNVFPSVLKSSTLLVDLRFGESVHACIVRLGFHLDLYTNNALMNMYAKFQSLDMSTRDEFFGLQVSRGHKIYVHEVLDGIPERNGDGQSKSVLVSCNEPNTDYRKRGFEESVLGSGDNVNLHSVELPCSDGARHVDEGSCAKSQKLIMGGVCKWIVLGREMRNANLKPDSFTLSSVLRIFAEYIDVIKGKEIHRYAIRHGLDTDLFIGSSLIDIIMPACAHMKTLHLGKQFHGYIIRNGYDDNVFIASSLVDMGCYRLTGYLNRHLLLLVTVLSQIHKAKMQASDRFNINSQLEHLQAKYVGTGHADLNRFEWAVNIQRDSFASYIGHYPMLAYFAIAENESIGRERYNFMQKMLLPCGLPPEREDD
ncbi:hypothetical protein QYF36_020222 [Acer negundo]|nr:hypothetical protein QYF36_020222 [Acer negundo]